MSKHTNPIYRIRKEKQLSVYELGVLAGVSGTRITQIESGEPLKLPAKILAAVEILGYDPQRVQDQYMQWRAAEKAAILKAVKR